jgi:hypothetical protein
MSAERIETKRRQGFDVRKLSDIAELMAPKRFKRVYAARSEDSLPYLRPYDIFDYLPVPADLLSATRNSNIAELRLNTEMILLTCSGRNLGPAVAVDEHIGQFLLSHDAIRITIEDRILRMYVLAFLNTPTGQELVRRDMSGSVIDHITVADAASLRVPILATDVVSSIADRLSAAVALREEARLELAKLHLEVADALAPISYARPADGWTTNASDLRGRLDAAPFLPKARNAALILKEVGGVQLGDVARLHKPASRYKAYHVSAAYGRPFLAGGQLRQEYVIGPKFMAERVFANPEWYKLHEGETVFAADGRAYEGLGQPVMITPDRHGWLASEHVLRARSNGSVDDGWLYLALANPYVQEQIQVLARGSVVDTLYTSDLESVILPPPTIGNGEAAAAAWAKFATADSLSRDAVDELEGCLHAEF